MAPVGCAAADGLAAVMGDELIRPLAARTMVAGAVAGPVTQAVAQALAGALATATKLKDEKGSARAKTALATMQHALTFVRFEAGHGCGLLKGKVVRASHCGA